MVKAIGLCYITSVGKVYKRSCNYCNTLYIGEGKYYCSRLCQNRDMPNRADWHKILSSRSKKYWTPERRKRRSEFNKEHGIRPYFPEGYIRPYRDTTGEKNPNWRGGRTLIGQAIRLSDAYKKWRKAVYERDNYKCQECGVLGNGKNLEAHHIKEFYLHPELRLDVNNGLTLCNMCHARTKKGAPR